MKNFHKILKFSFLLLIAIVFFTACKKDESDLPTAPGTQNPATSNNALGQVVNRDSDPDSTLCFDLVYPVAIELPDGSTQQAGSMGDLELIFENWVGQNPGDTTFPVLVYPLEVALEDGTTQFVNSEAELMEVIEECFDDIDMGWDDCFEIQYPVTVVYPDGTTAEADSDLELMNLFDEWYELHPADTLYPTLAFPIEMLLADGTTASVENEGQLEELFEACFDDWDDDEPFGDCFTIIYPVEVALPDGSVLTAHHDGELDQIFMDWFENNPNSPEFPVLVYPLQVELETGEIVTVEEEGEFMFLVESCFSGYGFEECFSFNYPVTLVMPDGTTVTVDSDQELVAGIDAWGAANPTSDGEITFQYPISVTLTENGSVVSVNSDDELEEILGACYDCLIVDGEGLVLGARKAAAAGMVVKRHPRIKVKQQQRISDSFAKERK